MATWDTEQIGNAQLGINACKAEGLGTNAQVIVVMTMITEATLVNVGYGDHPVSMGGAMSSSRGLFQQIAAWGPEADREDPAKATHMFLHGGAQGQRGLLDVNGWQNMSPWMAAQAVQGSEFPDGSNYRANYQFAVDLVNTYGGAAPAAPAAPSTPTATPNQGDDMPLNAADLAAITKIVHDQVQSQLMNTQISGTNYTIPIALKQYLIDSKHVK